MKNYSIALIFLFLLPPLGAATLDKRDAIQELVQKLEVLDPNIKSHQDDWSKVRLHLEQAAQQSESPAGLKISVQHILDQWGGLRFRILDRDDAQYWALNGEELVLPKAWFSQRGAKWLVQYSENRALRRGDSISIKEFSPYSREFQAQKSWKLSVQQKLLTAPTPISLDLTRQSLDQWALELSQLGSRSAVVDNNRICLEKIWFWLDRGVAGSIASKLENAPSLCKAMVIDLRDSFGDGLNNWPKVKAKMPIAVLTNHATREGAVALVKSLKADSGAKVFGETTDSDHKAQSKEALTKIDWTMIIVGDGGQIVPDHEMKDSFLNAEGVDDIQEAAFAWIRNELRR